MSSFIGAGLKGIVLSAVLLQPISSYAQPYLVSQGDTLWSIAASHLNSGFDWEILWKANPQVTNPDYIKPGDLLTIPDLQLNQQTVEAAPTNAYQNPKTSQIIVAVPTATLQSQKRSSLNTTNMYGIDRGTTKTVIEKNGEFVIVENTELEPKKPKPVSLGKSIYIDSNLIK